MVEPPQEQKPKTHAETAAMASEVVKAHCNKCGGDRNAYQRASHNGDDLASKSDNG
jgi:hypothetical protein